jgi:TonB-dependent SusC/RagA subfamily outer membrane receptor
MKMAPNLMRSTLLLSFAILLNYSAIAQNDFYSKRWSDVYKNEVKDRPQSALKIVDTIYYKAKKDKNITEITKALLYQSKFSLALQEDAELVAVRKFKKEIEASKAPLKNILESMLAQIYWQYFQDHRWKFYDRSTVSETVNPDDFRTWDARAILQEIRQHFRRSLSDRSLLQNTRLETFDDVLVLATNSKRYRPTLYDFLANYALDFYATNEAALQGPSPETQFEISNYFQPIDALNFNEPSIESGEYEALKLFRDLLVFHHEKRDTNAYVNLEIERLKFVKEHSDRSEDATLFGDALRNLKTKYARHEASTLIDLELASIFLTGASDHSESDTTFRNHKKMALEICNNAISRFPNSDGANRCKVLRDHILLKKLSLQAEKFLPVARPSRLFVSYTNLSNLFFKVYKVSNEFEKTFLHQANDSSRLALLTGAALETSWQSDLPQSDDHNNHSTELILPALPRGNYLIVASEARETSGDADIFAFAPVHVTDLALLGINNANSYRFQVVDRNNGKPISGADVRLRSIRGSTRADSVDERHTTDRNGFVEVDRSIDGRSTFNATVVYGSDTVLFQDYYYYYYNYRDDNRRKDKDEDYTAEAFFFTDRSIYRPGQTIFFKGILIKTKAEKSSVVAGEYVQVYLQDVNDEYIDSLRLKTNVYGSFSGELKLPASALTGEYTLYAEEDYEEDSRFYDNLANFEYSETIISVEEYKRPTFEVKVNPATGTFRLNDTIQVSGNAIAYNGSKISKAKVAYTVKRGVQYPRWLSWHYNHYSEPEVIAHGEVHTDEKGYFTIPFKAIPDDKISPDTKPVFTYSISVDVTDINGETRSAESQVKVGYHSMVATVAVPAEMDRQKPTASLSVTTENLNGQFLPATGTVYIYKLQGPPRPLRKRPWSAPENPVLSRTEFEKMFPNDPYGEDASTPDNWEKGKLIKELSFDTKKSKDLVLAIDNNWKIGAYRIELHTKDSVGQPVEDRATFQVVDSKGKEVPDNALLVFQTDKNSYKPGEVAKVKVGSAFSDANVTIEVEKNNKIVKTYTEQFSGGTKEFSIPITDPAEGHFTIHCSAVVFNSFVQRHKMIIVESTRQKFSIETETFKDKLQPGSKETWSFTINGEAGQKLEAEVLASMYDASLDQFKPHEWSFNPVKQPYHYSRYQINYYQSFGTTSFMVRNIRERRSDIPMQHYDDFDWFGFSMSNRQYTQNRYLERLYFDATSTGKASKVTMSHNRNARQGFVSGRVISGEDGSALPGVNVVVKGTTRGTATDAQGYYTIEVGKNEVLVFSFIGLVSAEVTAGKKNTIDVAMESDVMQLSEVIVTAYGEQQVKKSLGFSAMSVVENTMLSSEVVFEEALVGRTTGVFLQGAPGASYNIVIRGASSLPDNKPLYVVDGVVVESTTIDQDDLGSAQVLKGDAATALYGSRAANGVIIITTKSGQKKMDEELAKVNARKDFKETAFFYPHLSTDENGKIRFSFTTPESLTRWKLQLLAHTKELLTTTRTLQTVTQKEMMITPNLPRFVRVGDEVIISARIANLSGRKLDGKITLQLTDPINGQTVDQLFANVARNQAFKINPKSNTQVSWSIKVPQGIDVVQYKIVAKAGNFSDGEQNVLPVLQNRMLVTETVPLYVRSNQTKTFSLTKLQDHGSTSLQHHQLTLEITSNPAWYAIQSLPYLMEFPHECAEQLFSRFYANSIASHVVNSNPKIKEVFDKWAASGKLTSNLEKNQELRSIIIEETPWVRDAETESEKKKRIALLFDLGSMRDQLKGTVHKLKDLQFSNGAFPWFAGGRYADRYITQHVASGFGHLSKLKITVNDEMEAMMTKAVRYLDTQIVEDYANIIKAAETSAANLKNDQKQTTINNYLENCLPSSIEVHYLYTRSFYQHISTDQKTREAIEFLERQTAKKWLEYKLYQKGMIALVQHRSNNKNVARDIMISLRENAVLGEELGMYWKENVGGWYWHEAEVETQD